MNYMFGDLETDMIKAGEYLKVKSCAMVYEENKEVFTKDVKEFTAWIISQFNVKNRPIIYFHNLQFDFAFLFKEMIMEQLKGKGVECSFIIRGSQLLVVKFFRSEKRSKKEIAEGRTKERRRCIGEIRDSYALIPTSLKKLGEALKFHKAEINFETCSFEELRDYNLQDCKVLKKGLETLREDIEKEFQITIECLPLTIGSLSRTIMRKYYGTVYEMKNQQMNEWFRRYYFGGRCEVFDFKLWENVSDYDVNSLYPYVMQKYKFAEYMFYVEIEKSYSQMKDIDFVGIEATFEEKGEIPLMAEKVEKRLMFRKGVKRGFIFKEELDYLLALDQIKIITVHRAFYGEQEYLFKDYIEKCYKLRQTKDKPFYNLLFKMVMTSSYGKFAEKNLKDSLEMKELEEMEKKDFKNCREEIDGYFIIRKEKWVRLSLNVPIACKITAMSRLELHKKMMETIEKRGVLIYCDTDSIFTDKAIMTTSEELGGMKLEAKLTKLICLNAKEYAYDTIEKGRIKMKGFVNKEGTVEEFIKVYLKPFHITRKTTFKECLKKYQEDTEYFRYVEEKIKIKKTFYCKRVILDNLSTRALTTDELPSEIEQLNKEKILEMLENECINQ